MTQLTWIGGSSNSFQDKKNWNPQTAPGATSDVIIAPALATSIVAANDTINSLTTNANTTLSISATDTFTIRDVPGSVASTNGGTLSLGAAADLFLSGTFDNTGTLATHATSDVWVTGTVDNSGTIQQSGDVNVGNASTAGAIINEASGHWHISGNVDVTGGAAAGSSLQNAGSLIRDGVGVTDVSVATINSGQIYLGSGTMEFLRPVTNTGTMTVGGAGASLYLSTAVAGTGSLDINGGSLHLLHGADAGQTVDFMSSGTLDLNAPGIFAGTIAGFGANDLIDLVKTAATSATFGGGVLTVLNGAATVASLHMSGTYTSADFLVTSDNHNGSFIHFV